MRGNGARNQKKKKGEEQRFQLSRAFFSPHQSLTCRPDLVQQDVKGSLVCQRAVRVDGDEVVTGSGGGGQEGRAQVFFGLNMGVRERRGGAEPSF